ncbi:MAG: type IV pilin-like G/H family protein [Pseudanabaena sp.]
MSFNMLEYIVSLWLCDRRFTKAQSHSALGFTLIELMVTMIIIGILAAIALPAFLNQANKARFGEAKAYIATMSRLQQAYYLEKQVFAGNMSQLNLGANMSSSNFTYGIITGDISGNNTPVQLNQIVTNVATPVAVNAINPYLSVVGIPGVARIDTVFCVANSPSVSPAPGSLDVSNQIMVCPNNFALD